MPSRFEYFVASKWLTVIWFSTFVVMGISVCLYTLWPIHTATTWLLVLDLCHLPVAGVAAFFISGIVGAPILGSFYLDRAKKNGEPFRVGDTVHILKGKYKDTISDVYAVYDRGYANGHLVHVNLGVEAKKNFADEFQSWEIKRIARAKTSDDK